jgi:hypothetical protein
MIAKNPTQIQVTGDATGFIAAPGNKGKPITVVSTNSIRASFDEGCLQQALNAPGVTDLVLEAFQDVIRGVKGWLVYFISHNIARKELLPDGGGGFAGEGWVHRKGATWAFPAGHPSLKGTPFATSGHPVLLPGNPTAGSCIMVADRIRVDETPGRHPRSRCSRRTVYGRPDRESA